MSAKKILLLSAVLLLVGVMSYSAYQLSIIRANYAQEAKVHERMLQYRPVLQEPDFGGGSGSRLAASSASTLPTVNQSIIDMQADYPDVIGWLTIPNTGIDYPFAQGIDNDYYLYLDLDKNRLTSGTLFMDFRNNSDFSDFNTIIFGHNMKNGSMFGTLKNFDDEAFFNTNSIGFIFAANETYVVEFIAWIVMGADDDMVYNSMFSGDADGTAFLDYVRSIARHYRDIGAEVSDKFVTLSTCNYEFDDARMVLIGRVA